MATKALNYTTAEINQRLNLAGTAVQPGALNGYYTKTEVDGKVVVDLSVRYSASYANLSAALTALNGDSTATNIKKGGVSIKFINSGSGKYEQWNLKASSWSTNTSDWALDVDGSVTNDKLKLPFELEKPSSNEYVTQAECVGYGNSNVKTGLDTIFSNLSALDIEIVQSNNLLDMSKSVVGHISSSDGTLDTTQTSYKTSDYIDVSDKYNWYYCSNSSYCNVAFYDESKQFLYGQDNIPYSTNRKITNQDVKYARVSYPSSSTTAFFYVSQTAWQEAPTYEEYIEAHVIIHGIDMQLSSYALKTYVNEIVGALSSSVSSLSSQISALDIEVVQASDNLLDMSKAVTGHVSSSDGTLDTSLSQYKTSDYFDVSNKYNWYYCANTSYCNVAFYDENKQFLYGQDNIPYSTNRKITNQNVKYARVSYPSSYNAFFYVSQTQWTEAPTYEEYREASVSIKCDIQGIKLSGGEIDLGGGEIRINNGKILIGKSDTTVTVSDKLHHLVSIGQNACTDATSRAIAIGTNALASSTAASNSDNGHYNVAIGHNSMQSSTTGNHNTAVGWGTMGDLTTGTANSAFGEDALCHTVTGVGNTAIGNRAMQTATGSYNVSVGGLSMYSSSDKIPSGDYNVAVGYSAGCKNTGSGDNNTAIGHAAGCSSQYRYTTAIGANAIATKSRQVVIGSTGSGTPHPLETILNGDIIIVGTDMVARKLIYNQDGSIGWTQVTL